MNFSAVKQQTSLIVQSLSDNLLSIFCLMLYATTLSFLFHNPTVTFFGSVWLIFIFLDYLSEYILVSFGMVCYFLAISLHALGLDMREQLFLYATVFFFCTLIVKLTRSLVASKQISQVTDTLLSFPYVSFWTGDSAESLYMLGMLIAELPQETPIEEPSIQKTPPAQPTRINQYLSTASVVAKKFNQLTNRAPKKSPHAPPQPPLLDLSTTPVNKPTFFEPPTHKPLSTNFMLASLFFFISINLVVFWQRERIVTQINRLFGQTPPTTSTPFSFTPIADNLSSLDVATLQKDFSTIDFRPENVTPFFTPSMNLTVFPTSTVNPIQTIPPLLGPTEPPLAVEVNKTISVALLNGSGIADEGRFVEQLLERNNFYIEAIDLGTSTQDTIIYYKSGQSIYADRAAETLSSLYNVVKQQSLSNSYFTDLKILIGTRK